MEQSLLANIVLCCLSPELPADTASKLAQLSAPGWSRLLIGAAKQQVETLLYARLEQHGLASLIPTPFRQRLQRSYQADVHRNARLRPILAELLSEFQKAHIPVIVHQDAYLAEAVYAHFGLRRIGELDLLIAPCHIPAAVETLLALGYQPFGARRAAQAKALPAAQLRFMKAAVPTSVLLHQTLTPTTGLLASVDMPAVWRRAQPITVAGVAAWGLAPEDQLIALAAQAIQHQLLVRNLQAMCDLNLFIQHAPTPLHWWVVQERTEQWRWEKEVHLALCLVKTLLNAPIPADTLQLLQPADYSEDLLKQALHQLCATGWEGGAPQASGAVWSYQRLFEQGYKLLQQLHLARSTPSHI